MDVKRFDGVGNLCLLWREVAELRDLCRGLDELIVTLWFGEKADKLLGEPNFEGLVTFSVSVLHRL